MKNVEKQRRQKYPARMTKKPRTILKIPMPTALGRLPQRRSLQASSPIVQVYSASETMLPYNEKLTLLLINWSIWNYRQKQELNGKLLTNACSRREKGTLTSKWWEIIKAINLEKKNRGRRGNINTDWTYPHKTELWANCLTKNVDESALQFVGSICFKELDWTTGTPNKKNFWLGCSSFLF